MRVIANVLGAIAVTALGMLGLYLKIEYSGWVLFIGLLWAVAA